MIISMRRYVSEKLEIEEVFDVKDAGVTYPVECRLSNGIQAIVKYPHNPAGTRVLFNEFLGYSIADAVEASIPNYGICNLSEGTIRNTNQNEEIDCRNAGLCFFTQKLENTVPPNMHTMHISNNCIAEEMILLDYVLNNYDRHIGNVLLDMDSGKSVIIDFSHIIDRELKYDKDTIEKLSQRKSIVTSDIYLNNLEVYEIAGFLSFTNERMTNFASNIVATLNKIMVSGIIDSIPYEWKELIGKDSIELIEKMIVCRAKFGLEIAETIIQERRR